MSSSLPAVGQHIPAVIAFLYVKSRISCLRGLWLGKLLLLSANRDFQGVWGKLYLLQPSSAQCAPFHFILTASCTYGIICGQEAAHHAFHFLLHGFHGPLSLVYFQASSDARISSYRASAPQAGLKSEAQMGSQVSTFLLPRVLVAWVCGTGFN